MNATDIPGIWSDQLENGAVMIIDTNHNIIRVKPLNGSPIKYEIGRDILISDYTQIKESHEKGKGDRAMG